MCHLFICSTPNKKDLDGVCYYCPMSPKLFDLGNPL